MMNQAIRRKMIVENNGVKFEVGHNLNGFTIRKCDLGGKKSYEVPWKRIRVSALRLHYNFVRYNG